MTGGATRTWLVARREWDQRVRSRAFAIATAISIALVLALILIPDLAGGGTTRTVGLVGERSRALPSLVREAGDQLGISIETRGFTDRAAGSAALRADDVALVLVDQRELVWKSDVDERLGVAVTEAVQAIERRRAIDELGLSAEQVERVLRPATLTTTTLEPAPRERTEREELAMIGVGVLLMAIAFYGGFLVVGVVEEKSSRVVEVVLAHVRPSELFVGKIAGIGLAGLAQLGLIALAALVAIRFSTNPSADTAPGTIPWIVFWFVLGYAFYAVLYGTVGSLISRQEEAESIQFPVTAGLLVAYFVSMQAAGSPDGMAALVGSFVPFTAPMVMTIRIAHGDVAVWEIVLSIAIMAATTLAMVRLAARVYTGAVLRIGRRV
ncbi:MAG TPA: ABC transporter permease, partial [Actinomycetota bacterium]|nr:ABC transporter permease [Actinomycetota bacterium]